MEKEKEAVNMNKIPLKKGIVSSCPREAAPDLLRKLIKVIKEECDVQGSPLSANEVIKAIIVVDIKIG